MVGTSISHYDIVGKLGEGGMGSVYLARDRFLPRFVALKFLNAHLADSAEHVARFEEEARAISALNHPNIATIHGIEQSGEHRFLVLEYLPGGSLAARLAELRSVNGQLSIDQAIDYAIGIAEGLRHAHERGVVHRDIKASNVMFTGDVALKITDFGLARIGEGLAVTTSGNVIGTPPYMSPEQAQGKTIDSRSDIFSFGVLLYQLLTNELPFRGSETAAVIYQIVHDDPPDLREFRPDIPSALQQVVSKTLVKSPDRRFQKMSEVIENLRALQTGAPYGSARVRSFQETLQLRSPLRWKTDVKTAGLALILLTMTAMGASLLIPRIRDEVAVRFDLHSLPREKRIAVLPFSTASPENQALSDGLNDILSYKLAQLEQFHGTLLVIAASEINSKGAKTPSAARDQFGANLAITGTVVRSGEQIETMVSLVETRSMVQLRSTTIRARLAEITVFRDRVIAQVAQLLNLELTELAQRTLRTGETSVATAYARYIEARGYLQRHDRPGNLPKAIRLFRESVSQDPKFALAYSGIAEAFLAEYDLTKDPRNLDEAYTQCERAIELNDQLESVHVTMGLIASARGEFEIAGAEFQRVLSLNPINAEARRGLARVYESRLRLKDAAAAYKEAIRFRPSDWTGYNYLGGFYFHQGCYREAEPYFQKVKELTPDNPLAYTNLGAIYLELGRRAEAIDVLQKSLSLNPGIPMTISNLGTAYYMEGRYAEAAQWLEKATQLAPQSEWTWGNLGHARRYAPDLAAQAPDAFRRAIDLGEREAVQNPRDADLQARLAMYWAGLGDTARSLKAIVGALVLAPKSGFVQYRAALVYEQAGNRAGALRAAESALQLAYSLEEIEKAPALQRLRDDPRYHVLLAKQAPATTKACAIDD